MDKIIDVIKKSRATLFLGAGCSMGVGGPSGYDLLSRVVNHFDDVDYFNKDNFFEVCEDIAASPNHSKGELESFIKKNLSGLFPNETHEQLLKIPWRCIFTTNYDLVIEKIDSNSLENRTLRVIKQNKPEIDLRRQDVLYYVKMLGSIDSENNEEGNLILTKAEYTTSFLRRSNYYNILGDCLREGPVIFIGYSFEDDLVFNILSELRNVVGSDIIRPSYAIMPDALSDRKKRFFDRFKITHVNDTFENFTTQIKTEFVDTKFELPYSEKTIHVRGYPIDIPLSLERPSREHFTFLHSKSWDSDIKTKKSFFCGEDKSFYPYTQKWDLSREIYSFDHLLNPEKCKIYGKNIICNLKNHIFQFADDPLTDNNSIVFLEGAAGCGKSIILNRLAFDWYTSGLPVIFIDTQSLAIDFKQVDTFINHLDKQFEVHNNQKNRWPKPRTLIIADGAGDYSRSYIDLFNYLTARGKAITMMLADRENLIDISRSKNDIVYTIPESISNNERESFKNYLFSIGIIESEAEIYKLIEDSEINTSFFALMYTIINETRRPLNEIIIDQYNKLSGIAKQIYEYVCLFNYYGINPNEELLVRATTSTFAPFREEIDNGALKKVIFPEYTEWDNVDYRLHHPILALYTIKHSLFDPLLRINKYKELLSELNPSSRHEIKKVERLLISGFGANSNEKDIPFNLRRELFELVSSRIESRSIYHHYALLELEGESKEINFELAEHLLKKALICQNNSTERDEFIYTSFGKFYSQKGSYLEDNNKLEEAYNAYKSAENFFKKGRSKIYKNLYSYHGQIVLNKRRAQKSTEEIDKLTFYTEALKLCEEALSNLSYNQQEEILSQEARIYRELGDIDKYSEIIRNLASDYNNPLGYELSSLYYYKKSFEEENQQKKIHLLEEAYNEVQKGYSIKKDNVSLLKIESKIGLKLFADDTDRLYDILQKWYQNSDQMDIKLLFEYGVISFILGYYEISRKVFDNLEIQSQGIPKRSSIINGRLLKQNNQPKRFTGIVESVDYSGKTGFIKCTDLPNLKYELRFSPQKSSFTPSIGDYVKFTIFFNLRGIYAYNVRKD